MEYWSNIMSIEICKIMLQVRIAFRNTLLCYLTCLRANIFISQMVQEIETSICGILCGKFKSQHEIDELAVSKIPWKYGQKLTLLNEI